MNTKLLALSAIMITLAGIGIATAAGFGAFKVNMQDNYNWSNSTSYNGIWNGSASYNGIWNGSASYNGMHRNVPFSGHYNATAAAKEQASIAQCETTRANNVSAVTSSKFGINVSTSQLDQANSNVQSNVTVNATSWYTRMSLAIFQNSLVGFFLHYVVATHSLNATQLTSLRTSLNGSRTALKTCISEINITGVQGHGNYGIGAGLGIGRGIGIGSILGGNGFHRYGHFRGSANG